MQFNVNFINIVNRVQEKYKINCEDANDIVEFAVISYRNLKNDFETSLDDYSDDVIVWIKKASFEIAERYKLGIASGIKSYSENGYSFSADGGMLSQQLINEIIPNIDYPK